MARSKDSLLLLEIAKYRVLIPEQATVLGYGGERNARRSLIKLAKNALSSRIPLDLTGKRGRPGSAFTLTEKGIDLLRKDNFISSKTPYENLIWDRSRTLFHQVLVNWVGIHFEKLSATSESVQAKYLSSTSPFTDPEEKVCLAPVEKAVGDPTECGSQILYPDAVVGLRRSGTDSSLLFFVEADCGTETLRSGTGLYPSIERKVQLYQHLLSGKEYKKYEDLWKTSLMGFRLLFVAATEDRRRKIERLVRELTPEGRLWMTDFIWTTSWNQIQEHGIADMIWTRGSSEEGTPESILGPRLSYRCPISP